MKIILAGMQGQPVNEAVADRLHSILSRLNNAGKVIQTTLVDSVRHNFQQIYPGSKHYDPQKVQPLEAKDGINPSGSISIDVPGITRAYHSLTIRPKFRKRLTIPLSVLSYNKKASDFQNTVFVRKKDGKEFIAQKNGSALVFLFYLAKSAFQPRDSKLMPSDQALANSIFSRTTAYITAAR